MMLPLWGWLVVANLAAGTAIAVWLLEDAFGFERRRLHSVAVQFLLALILVGFGVLILWALIGFHVADRVRARAVRR